MRVICNHHNPDNRPDETPMFDYGLVFNKEYIVVGMAFASNQIWYLVDEGNKPNFFPHQIFTITDDSLHWNWCFKLFPSGDETPLEDQVAMWGYEELIQEPRHYEGLIMREKLDLEIYFRRKMECLENK